jgi:antidote-toxin recognition MazE-like antitoxin
MPSPKPRSRNRKPATSRQKVRAHRERLRAQGLRPIQIWVPDTRSPRFTAQASRQSRLVASSRHATEDQAFIDALSSED